MKINWGAGITAMYLGFVVMIVVLVSMSASQKIDLVTDNYYEKELQFQDQIDKIARTRKLAEPLTWAVTAAGVRLTFPKTFADSSIRGACR